MKTTWRLKMMIAQAVIIVLGISVLYSCQKIPGQQLVPIKVPVKQYIPVNDIADYGFQTDPLPSDFYIDVTRYLIPEDNIELKGFGIKKGLLIPANVMPHQDVYYLKQYTSTIDSLYIQTVFYMKSDPSNFNVSYCVIGINKENAILVPPIEIIVTKMDSSLWEVRKTFKAPYAGGYNTVYIGSGFDVAPSTAASLSIALSVSGFYCKTSRSNPARTSLVVTHVSI